MSIIADRATSTDKDPAEFDALLKRIEDPDAKRVAQILIHDQEPIESDPPRVKTAVAGFRQWVQRNRTVHAPYARRAAKKK